MNNLFGKSLRARMEKTGIKESELADALSYDTTYISKWLNGNKLPSVRNAERIIGQMADFLVDHPGNKSDLDRETQWQECFTYLKKAYDDDSRYLVFQGYNNNQMSFLNNQQTLFQLTKDAVMQALEQSDYCISITATFDLFRLYGKEFKQLIQQIYDMGAKKVKITLALDPDAVVNDPLLYTSSLLGTIGRVDSIEFSIVTKNPAQPLILIINDLLCLQVLWYMEGDLAAVFSMDKKIVHLFADKCRHIIEGSEKLLDPAEPESLKRTNVQLDSYSARQMWLFFNEPPALLFPEEIMDMFISKTEDDVYANYLVKLKNTFSKHTRRSNVTLILYASILNRYLSEGNVCVGNVRHHLTEEQTHSHIEYLSQIMKENPEFNIYLIRDTVVFNEELNKSPSIFLDPYSVNLENSKKDPNNNYHISMDPRIREAFQRFFEHTLKQPYCTRLSADDLLRYI